MNNRLTSDFFKRDVLEVAPDLIGKTLVRRFNNNKIKRYTISETEAYRGGNDRACHANKGRTKRTEIMFAEGGVIYVYLIYGMYWMLNFVTSEKENPSAVLIRGIDTIFGPGKVGKELQLDKSFYGETLFTSNKLWVEESGIEPKYSTAKRVGIDYAGEPWVNKPWRFILNQ